MPISAEFQLRARAVKGYLRSLEDMERQIDKSSVNFYRATEAINASRAAAFIMMYNCIEWAVRECVSAVRQNITASGLSISEINDYWKGDIVQVRFAQRLRSGGEHASLLRHFANFLPGRVSWGSAQRALPFAGNIDHEQLFALVSEMGADKWAVSKKLVGGSDLRIIKNARNELAHGEETFLSVGALHTTQDLIIMFARARMFTLSFISQMEEYIGAQGYKRP